MKDTDAGKEVCSFLENKLALFNQYLSITKRMKETFGNKKEGDLEAFLSERQGCITKIEGIDGSMEKIIKEGPDKLSNITDKCKGLIDDYLKNIKGIMEETDLIDRELAVMVKKEGEGVKTELLKMRGVRQAAKGYKGQGGFSPRFLDTMR